MAALRLSDSQKAGLVVLYRAEVRSAELRDPRRAWVGAREGVSGTTLEALERRGLALARWTEKPYPRIVGRIKQPGIALVREKLLAVEADA